MLSTALNKIVLPAIAEVRASLYIYLSDPYLVFFLLFLHVMYSYHVFNMKICVHVNVFLLVYNIEPKKKEKTKIGMNPFFHLECQTLILFFFTAKTYIKQVYLEEGGQIRYIW